MGSAARFGHPRAQKDPLGMHHAVLQDPAGIRRDASRVCQGCMRCKFINAQKDFAAPKYQVEQAQKPRQHQALESIFRKPLKFCNKTPLGSTWWCFTKSFTICDAQSAWAVSAISSSHPRMMDVGFGPWSQCLGHIFGFRCALGHVKTVLKPPGQGLSGV